MSIAKRAADVWILKLIDPPPLTLNGSAKPWIVVLGLVRSQVDCGVPVFWFSHTIGLAHAAWAGAADTMAGTTAIDAPTSIIATGAARRRSRWLRERSRTCLSTALRPG